MRVMQVGAHPHQGEPVFERVASLLQLRERPDEDAVPRLADEITVGKEVLADRPDLECRGESLGQGRVP